MRRPKIICAAPSLALVLPWPPLFLRAPAPNPTSEPPPARRLCLHGCMAQPTSCGRHPDDSAACQTFGPFFRSKFLFHSLRLTGFALAFVLALWGGATLGRSSHS